MLNIDSNGLESFRCFEDSATMAMRASYWKEELILCSSEAVLNKD